MHQALEDQRLVTSLMSSRDSSSSYGRHSADRTTVHAEKLWLKDLISKGQMSTTLEEK